MRARLASLLRAIAEKLAPEAAEPDFEVVGVRSTNAFDAAWDKALTDYLLSVGTKARATAAAWATSAAGLLAVLSATAFLKGRETLDALAEPWPLWLLVAVLVSLVAAFWTLYTAALGAQGAPSPQLLAPDTYRISQFRAADDAVRALNRSRRWIIPAFLAAAIAMIISLAAPAAPSTTSTLVIGGDGRIQCGKLEVTGATLTVGSSPLPTAPVSFHTVKECPK